MNTKVDRTPKWKDTKKGANAPILIFCELITVYSPPTEDLISGSQLYSCE
jgi:hypothetical protein